MAVMFMFPDIAGNISFHTLDGLSCQDYPTLCWDGMNEGPSHFTNFILLPSSSSKTRTHIS